MKRLIALIGAVATAFGLYAADSHYYATSFEADVDNGCTTEPLAFNLSTAGWTAGTTTETSIDLGTYESGEGYNYAGNTGARRTFTSPLNNNYLKLETGTNTVGVLLDQTDIFIDQTVKFTGFEEAPAADAIDGQIAIWASAIEADDTAEPAIVGETNLYARVGNGTTYTDVKIDLDDSLGDFDPSKWYRLTIKSLGNVLVPGAKSQAGFLVYINGLPATTSEKYSTFADNFTDAAKGYYTKGQLFTGIKTDSAEFTTVAFQGIGSIDDFVTSVEAPDFAAAVGFTVAAITGATIDKVVAIDGVNEVELTAPYAVMPGTTIKVYFKAANGYRLDAYVATITINEAGVIDVSDQINVVEGYATLNGAIKGEAELADMMAGLKANDRVAFLKNGDVTKDDAVLYSFTKNTQIDVAEGGAWTLSIMNVAAEEPGTFVANADIANDITVAYESGDEFDIYANTIPAGITVDASDENGSVLLFADPITVAGTLKVNSSATFAGTITLDGAGSVWSATQLACAGEESIFTNGEVVEAGNAESGYTYSLNATPAEQPFVPSATVAKYLAAAIDHLKANYYNKYTNGDKVAAPHESYVKVGTLASDVTGTVSIGGTVADAGEKFSLSIGNNAFLESAKFKIVGREVYVAAVILAIEQVKVKANETDYPIESANSGNLELKSFAAVAPTTIAGEGTNFTIVRGDDKPLVKFFFTDEVTQYFVTKKTFIGKDKVATTSYGFTTPDEGGLWLYLGYGVGLGGNWDGVTYNYTVYAFGVDKKAITLSMSITDKSGELTSWDDVTDNTPIADLPCLSDADKTALAAAEVSATKVSAWAKGNGKVTIGTDTIKLEAFLLNVENTDTAIAAEKAAFKIPSITVNADGTVTVTEPTGSYNGTITIKGSTTPNGDFTLPVTDTSARFFKAFLGL